MTKDRALTLLLEYENELLKIGAIKVAETIDYDLLSDSRHTFAEILSEEGVE